MCSDVKMFFPLPLRRAGIRRTPSIARSVRFMNYRVQFQLEAVEYRHPRALMKAHIQRFMQRTSAIDLSSVDRIW